MCGLVVMLGLGGRPADAAVLARMAQTIAHRGPDDSEVLLAAYRHWGPSCLAKLNGMWAFVIHDRRSGVLFGARDRFGVKPLFVHRGKDCWLLASEVKAILASGLYVRETNWQVSA